jgi:hypothetical protein
MLVLAGVSVRVKAGLRKPLTLRDYGYAFCDQAAVNRRYHTAGPQISAS